MKLFTIVTPNYLPFFENYFQTTLENLNDKFELVVHFLTSEPGGDFNTDGFHRINYLKLKYLQEKVLENRGDVILFCDADVIFLNNFQDDILNLIADYDMLFQDDYYAIDGIKFDQYNTGVWVVKCNENSIRFFDESLLNLSWEIFLKRKMNDQDYVNDQLKSRKEWMKTTKLPLTFSAIHQFDKAVVDKIPDGCKLFHLTCLSSVDDKIKYIEENFEKLGILI